MGSDAQFATGVEAAHCVALDAFRQESSVVRATTLRRAYT
jgi:hypothetical protein